MATIRKVLGMVLVIGGVLIAIKLGIINPGSTRQKTLNKVSGVTNTARGVVGGGSGRHSDSDCIAACRSNLARINGAKKRVAQKSGFATGSVSRSALAAEMGSIPVCPCGGSYSIGSLEQYPKCTGLPGG